MYLCKDTERRNMNRKTIITLIVCALAATGVAAQEERPELVFEPAVWDFGSVREADGPVRHTFTGVNRGDRPLVILDVTTTCGCTVPRFSKRPVLPGDRTEITVSYDPTNRPGTFDKELWIYSSDRKRIATLTIRGEVVPRAKSVEELYPVDAGGGLRLNTTLCAFTYIYPGVRMQSSVGYVNTSDRTVSLELRPDPAIRSGLLRIDAPERIAPDARGAINISYLIPADTPRYGTLRDALELFVDGRSRGTTIVAHGIGADNPSDMPEEKAPRSEVSTNVVKFGPVKHDGPRPSQSLTLSNTGRGDLIVRAVECGEGLSTPLEPGLAVPPGGSARIEVRLDPSADGYGARSFFLLLVTNDPLRPMRRIRATAVIEE